MAEVGPCGPGLGGAAESVREAVSRVSRVGVTVKSRLKGGEEAGMNVEIASLSVVGMVSGSRVCPCLCRLAEARVEWAAVRGCCLRCPGVTLVGTPRPAGVPAPGRPVRDSAPKVTILFHIAHIKSRLD